MDCSLTDSSVHGISQARILEGVAISFSRGSCRPGVELGSFALQAYSLPTHEIQEMRRRTCPPLNALGLLTPPSRRSRAAPPRVRDGGRVREDAAVVGAGGFRLRSARGLAGKPAAAALPGLEEEEAARQAGGDAEEAGSGLRSPPCWSPPTPARPPRDHLACPVRRLGHS